MLQTGDDTNAGDNINEPFRTIVKALVLLLVVILFLLLLVCLKKLAQ